MRISVSFLLVLFLVFTCQGNIAFSASAPAKKNEREDKEKTRILNRSIISWQNKSGRMTQMYEQLVRDIRSGKEKVEHNIKALRVYYTYTRYYEPFSKKLIDEMTKYAYIVDTSKDREEVNDALDKYREIISKHLAHLGVVSYALTLSRIDVRYGDEAFLKRVRDAIHDTWSTLPEPGTTPERAYNIITYAEGRYILETYGATVQKSEIYQVGKSYYDVRDIVTEDGEEMQIYFDVSTPIRTVQIIQGVIEKERKVTIPLQ